MLTTGHPLAYRDPRGCDMNDLTDGTISLFDRYKAASRAHLDAIARHRALDRERGNAGALDALVAEVRTASAVLDQARGAYLSDPDRL